MENSEFKTLFGGILSVLIKICVISIAILLTVTIFQKGNTVTSVNKYIFTKN